MSKFSRALVVVTLLVATAAVGLGTSTNASATPYTNRPKLIFNTIIAILTKEISITGKGFVPYENVALSIDKPTPVQKIVKADATGSFTTTVLIPGALLLGTHTIIATGQFAHDGYDVATGTVLVVLPPPVIALPVGYQHPLAADLPVAPAGATASPTEGLAVAATIGIAAVVMLTSGGYILLAVRRRTAGR